MNDKELVHIANLIREALCQLRKSRYMQCMLHLSLFTNRFDDVVQDSRKLGRALARDWFAASERTCTAISRHLGEIPYAVSKAESLLDRRQKEIPTLSAVTEELRALQKEFDDVAFNGEEGALCVVTEPITLEDVYLGRFRIALYLDKLAELYHKTAYYVIAIDPHSAATDEAITHPHVSNEVLCEGDGGAAIKAALEEGRLCDFFTMVRSILNTYNPDSPYVALSDWNGVSCYDCGYVMDYENSYYCTYCDNAVCDSCSRICTDCGEVVCSSCVGHCEICDRSLCPNCAKTQCSDCESVCCESCLNDGLCPACKEEGENEDEEETDTTTETPAIDTPATTALGGRLAGGGTRAEESDATVQPDGMGQAPVLPHPIRG